MKNHCARKGSSVLPLVLPVSLVKAVGSDCWFLLCLLARLMSLLDPLLSPYEDTGCNRHLLVFFDKLN